LIEIANQLQIDTPRLVGVTALLKLQARTLGLYTS